MESVANCDTCHDNVTAPCHDCEQHQHAIEDRPEAFAKFNAITWADRYKACLVFTGHMLDGVEPFRALRMTECECTQVVRTAPDRTPREQRRIERTCHHARARLETASELLQLIELGHQRGQDWVPLAEAPWHAVKALKTLKVLKIIKFDGDYFGQLEGAI